MANTAPEMGRLVECARYLPQSVRLLGTRYRGLFLAHARQCAPAGGGHQAVADAIAFVEFMLGQDRLSLMTPEKKALKGDVAKLKKNYRLRRKGNQITAIKRWAIFRFLPF